MAGVKRADRIAPRDGQLAAATGVLARAVRPGAAGSVRGRVGRAGAGLSPDDVDGLVEATLPLADPIDRFFTDVLVMADDPDLRASRLGLLQRIRDLPRRSFEVAQVPVGR